MSSGLGSITCQACITDPYRPDLDLFDKFIQGTRMDDIIRSRRERRRQSGGRNALDYDMHAEIEDVYDEFRMFQYLLHYLQRPNFFLRSCPVPLSREMRTALLSRYFDLSPNVCRDIYGKKLKDLRSKDASDKYQVDNVKLVYRQIVKEASETLTADDRSAVWHGEVVVESKLTEAIRRHFELPKDLARTYAVICFSIRWNLSIEKLKRARAGSWKWKELFEVTNAIMQAWSEDQGNLSPAFESGLRLELNTAVLDAYCTDIGRRFVMITSMESFPPTKLHKIVRNAMSSLLTFANNLVSKLSSLYTYCENWMMDAISQTGVQTAALDLLQAAITTPFPKAQAGKKKGGAITLAEEEAWGKFLSTVNTISQYITAVSTNAGTIRMDSFLRAEMSFRSNSDRGVPPTPDSGRVAQVGQPSPDALVCGLSQMSVAALSSASAQMRRSPGGAS